MTVLGAYVSAWGGLLLSADAIFWDDWTVFDATMTERLAAAVEAGLVWTFLLSILAIGGPVLISVLAVLAWSASALSLLRILTRMPFLSASEATFGAAVFATAPLMAARNSAVLVVYILSLTSVLVLWDLLTSPQAHRRRLGAVLPLVLLASLTPSAGMFLALPVLHLIVLHRGALRESNALVSIALMVVIPIAQFLGSRRFFPAHGEYEGYNALSLEAFVMVALATGLSLLVSVVVTLALWQRHRHSPRFGAAIVSVGLTLALFSLVPYVSVGQEPPYREWGTRHELLLPVALAVGAVGLSRLLRAIPSRSAVPIAMVAAVFGLAVQSASISSSYFRDWKKQEALIGLIRSEPNIELAHVVHFVDLAESDNLFQRKYRQYEWNGLMVRAFGDSRRLAVPSLESIPDLLSAADGLKETQVALYRGARDFEPSEARYLARVTVLRDNAAPEGIVLSTELKPLGPFGGPAS